MTAAVSLCVPLLLLGSSFAVAAGMGLAMICVWPDNVMILPRWSG